MHVLFLPSWYPNLKKPYDGNFIQNHASAVSMYADVTVVFCTSSEDILSTYDVKIIEKTKLREVIIYFKHHESKLVRFFRKCRAYRKGLKQVSRYDLIHSHVFFNVGILAVFLSIFHWKKLVHTEHSSIFHNLNATQLFWFKLLGTCIDMHTPVSHDLMNTLNRYGMNEKKITVIPNAIDTEHFNIKTTPRQKLIHFLHISKYEDERKNLTGILRVFERLSEVSDQFFLEIGGDGDIHWLRDRIDEFNIPSQYVTISDSYSYADLPTIYSNADCFILFSHFENFGVVLAESILCGTPVIAPRVGGIVDFVNNMNGKLVDANNEDQLYETILNYLNDKFTYEPEIVRNSIKDYVSYENVGKSYFEIYTSLIK